MNYGLRRRERAKRVLRFAGNLRLICALETLKRAPLPTVCCGECGEEKLESECEDIPSIGLFCDTCRSTRDCDTCGDVYAWKDGDDEETCSACHGYARGREEATAEASATHADTLELARWVVELFSTFNAQGVDFELTDLMAKHNAERLIKSLHPSVGSDMRR